MINADSLTISFKNLKADLLTRKHTDNLRNYLNIYKKTCTDYSFPSEYKLKYLYNVFDKIDMEILLQNYIITKQFFQKRHTRLIFHSTAIGTDRFVPDKFHEARHRMELLRRNRVMLVKF